MNQQPSASDKASYSTPQIDVVSIDGVAFTDVLNTDSGDNDTPFSVSSASLYDAQ